MTGELRHARVHSRIASPSGLPEELLPDEHVELAVATSLSLPFVHVQGRYKSILVWEDEDEEKWDHQGKRLVLGREWLYKEGREIPRI